MRDEIKIKKVYAKADLPPAKHNKDAVFLVSSLGALYASDGETWVQQTAEAAAKIKGAGLTVTVAPFSLAPSFDYAGGSITAIDNRTQYLALNIHTKALHMLPRQLDHGVIWLAKVVAAGGSVEITPISPTLPDCRIPDTLKRLRSGDTCKIHLFGSSLTAGAGGSPRWTSLNFDAAQVAAGYNVAGIGSVTTYDTFAVGGADAQLSAAVVARPVIACGNRYSDTNLCFNAQTFAEALSPALVYRHKLKQSTALACNVAVIGLLANGGNAQLDVYEGVIRTLRKAGVEVVLNTDNTFSDGTTLWADGDAVAQLADKYGCHLADTAAYVKEQEWRGNSPWADSIHMSAVGHVAWAAAIAGSFATAKRRNSYSTVTKHLASPTAYARTVSEISFRPVLRTGPTPTPVSINYTVSVADLFGETKQYFPFVVGEDCVIGHPLCVGMTLVIDQASNFTAEVYTNGSAGQGGTLEKTITFASGPLSRLGTMEVWKETSLSGTSVSRALRVTSGEMRVVGVIYYTPDYDEIPQSAFQRFGSGWSSSLEATHYSYPVKYTDTLNDGLIIAGERCRGLAYMLQSRPTAGQVTETIDGVDESTNYELYSTGSYYKLRKWSGRPLGQHCAIVKLTGVNASASATSSGQRRLLPIQAFAINDR